MLYYYLGFGYILTNFGSSCIFTLLACVGNNLSPNRQYPQYWYKDPSSSSTSPAVAVVAAAAAAPKHLNSEIALTSSIVISSDDSGSGSSDVGGKDGELANDLAIITGDNSMKSA